MNSRTLAVSRRASKSLPAQASNSAFRSPVAGQEGRVVVLLRREHARHGRGRDLVLLDEPLEELLQVPVRVSAVEGFQRPSKCSM